MKSFLSLLLILTATSSFSQKIYKHLITKEIEEIDAIYDGKYSYTGGNFEYDFDIIKVDTLIEYQAGNKRYFDDLIRVKISFEFHSPMLNCYNKKSADTLDFYLIHDLRNYYKLFGFYHSNIREYFMNDRSGEKYDYLYSCIVDANLLSKADAKKYIKIIKGDYNSIPSKFKKSCNLLRCYYPNSNLDMISTILLPTRPFFGNTNVGCID